MIKEAADRVVKGMTCGLAAKGIDEGAGIGTYRICDAKEGQNTYLLIRRSSRSVRKVGA
jgi:hypothetical protein